MKNITVTVSDQAYRRARVWAAERDSSLSRIVQYLIETLPGISRAADALPVAKSDSTGAAAPPAEAFEAKKSTSIPTFTAGECLANTSNENV
ncbi:MAG TPA: hypothetical protein VGE83_09410 [Terracidiphilus sp.]|jgi:hypothetical protein